MNDWFEAEQRVERAQELFESQRWEEALVEIEVALSINPNNATWHAHRGIILEELERYHDAAGAYECSLEQEPNERDVAEAFGSVLIRLGRFARSLEVFEELAKLYPDFEPAYCNRIRSYAELGRHEQAEEMFYLAQDLSDSCPHCFFSIGASLASRGQTKKAIYCWERVLDLEPHYGGVNRRIAQAYRAQGQLEPARDYFLREVRDDPGNTDLLYELGDLALESGQVATAAAKFAQIIELDPSNITARLALGKIWLKRGQAGQAMECFEGIGELLDDDVVPPEFDRVFAEALFKLQRYGEARKHLVQATRLDPRNTAVLTQLGDCLVAMNKPADAANCYRRALAVDTHDPFAHYKLGTCLFRLGNTEAAVEHNLAAIREKPDFVSAMHNAYVAYLRIGKWREARSMLRRALRVDPTNQALLKLAKQVWRHRLQHCVGKFSRALKMVSGRSVR